MLYLHCKIDTLTHNMNKNNNSGNVLVDTVGPEIEHLIVQIMILYRIYEINFYRKRQFRPIGKKYQN